MNQNKTATTELLEQLVRINSVNPDLVPGGAGENQIAKFVQSWLDARGFETHWLEGISGRPSVVGIARGHDSKPGAGKSLMLNGHIDTVSLAGFDGDALEPRFETVAGKTRMIGRGAFDMKCGVAAMLTAAAHAKTLNLRGDVIVACVSDEENGSIGSSEVAQQFTADAAIVCEPTNQEMVLVHKGFVWASITVHGKAAHGSRPDLGIDAIAKMGGVLVELEALGNELRSRPAHPMLGTGSIHASIIAGGEERSSYPATCTLEVERRTIPGETLETVRNELQAIIERCTARDAHFQATIKFGLSRTPHECQQSEAIVQNLKKHAQVQTGLEPKISGTGGWTDCAILSGAGIPSFLYGPIGDGAHAAYEWVDLGSVEVCAKIYLETIKEFCA